jgi:hypothetical protein
VCADNKNSSQAEARLFPLSVISIVSRDHRLHGLLIRWLDYQLRVLGTALDQGPKCGGSSERPYLRRRGLRFREKKEAIGQRQTITHTMRQGGPPQQQQGKAIRR